MYKEEEYSGLRKRVPWRGDIAVLGTYFLLTVILTYPLVFHFTSHVPGDGSDDPALVWNLWWVKHALVDLRTNPLLCDFMFYPIGIDLTFYTLTIVNGLASVPLQSVVGLVASSNVILFLTFILSSYGAYLLVKYVLPSEAHPSIAFISGLIYAFSSNRYIYASLGQFNIASTEWIPFYILFLIMARRQPHRVRYVFLAAFFLLFNGYTEFTYASFLIIFTFVYALYWLAADGWRQSLPFVRNLVLVALIFLFGMSPILYRMVRVMAVEGDFLVEGLGFANVFSADLLGFLVPSHLHPLRDLWRGRFDFSYLNFVFIGYTVLIVSAYGAVSHFRERRLRFWVIAAAVFALISLGPTLRVNGREFDLPLPFDLLQALPFFKGNRYPSRYSVMLALCWATLAGYGLHRLSGSLRGKWRRWAFAASIASLILIEHLSVPLPLSDMKVPGIYQTIAAEEGDFSVLEIPLAWRNGFRVTGTKDPVIMFEQFYQTTHEKRLVGGNTSRNPEFSFQYFTEAPVINSIIALETGHEVSRETWDQDRQLAPSVLSLLNARYVILHTDEIPAVLHDYVTYVVGGEEVYDRGGIVAYRVTAPTPRQETVIDLGTDAARLNLGEGWSETGGEHVWAQRKETRVFVSLPHKRQQMTLRVMAPGPDQILEIVLNGHAVTRRNLSAGWQEYQVALPVDHLRDGPNELRFRFTRMYPVSEIRDGDYTIGETGIAAPVNILVKSASEEVGDFGHIYVDGRNLAPDERGYNIVVLDARSGLVERTGHFDTFASEEQSQLLADFIATIPAGKIVAVAVEDEASLHLTVEAVRALDSIGATGDLRGRFRWEHAVIGVKGATRGQALERMGVLQPATVRVGQGLTEPTAAAAFDYVSFQAVD
ncbi:MAG: interleukin-like EMT inducer domain-containing protein [Anaerolineae bacterium]